MTFTKKWRMGKNKASLNTLFFILIPLTLMACGGGNSSSDDTSASTTEQQCPVVIGVETTSTCRQAGVNDDAVCFVIEAENAEMHGLINSDIESRVQALLSQCPAVKNIVMVNVPGSDDDDANLRALLKVYRAGLNTELRADSLVASGGTDFFLAGNKRVIAEKAKIGVHSWAESDANGTQIEGSSFPRDHQQHQPYIDTYVQIGMSRANAEDFYYFTINAAPSTGMHYMTRAEITQYILER